MKKLVIDCTTGDERYEDLTPEEEAQRQRELAEAATAREQVRADEAAQRQRDEDMAAMLAEWRRTKAAKGTG